MTTRDHALSGLRIFAVEDETLVAMMLEVMLEELGCEIVGVAGSFTSALAQINVMTSQLDAAVLDINLGGEPVYPVADALVVRGVPFLFCTGYGSGEVIKRYKDRLVLDKPFSKLQLAEGLASICMSSHRNRSTLNPMTSR